MSLSIPPVRFGSLSVQQHDDTKATISFNYDRKDDVIYNGQKVGEVKGLSSGSMASPPDDFQTMLLSYNLEQSPDWTKGQLLWKAHTFARALGEKAPEAMRSFLYSAAMQTEFDDVVTVTKNNLDHGDVTFDVDLKAPGQLNANLELLSRLAALTGDTDGSELGKLLDKIGMTKPDEK